MVYKALTVWYVQSTVISSIQCSNNNPISLLQLNDTWIIKNFIKIISKIVIFGNEVIMSLSEAF